jgi:diaminohydroxyphosphoribosylaminopyrimidine deaminase/5-amino-6-(5-phosphoribosylamino)uracil reductase
MQDEMYMARALKLAQRGRFTTHPNPNVGCVIVKDGEIVGEGFHYRAGEPHAEVHALRMAGEKARGATAYVTLEPCSHHGRTPPCCEALIAAGVAAWSRRCRIRTRRWPGAVCIACSRKALTSAMA